MYIPILRSGSFNVSEFDGNKDNDMYVYSNTQKWFFYVLQFCGNNENDLYVYSHTKVALLMFLTLMETKKTIFMYVYTLKGQVTFSKLCLLVVCLALITSRFTLF